MKLQRERLRKDREAHAERIRREQEQAEQDKIKEEEEKYVHSVFNHLFRRVNNHSRFLPIIQIKSK